MAQQAAAAKAKRAPQNPAANLLLSFAQQNKPEDIQRVLDGSKLELRWGALDPSEGNSVGQTALHVACLWGNLDAAVCLVQNKVPLRDLALKGATWKSSSNKQTKYDRRCARHSARAGSQVSNGGALLPSLRKPLFNSSFFLLVVCSLFFFSPCRPT